MAPGTLTHSDLAAMVGVSVTTIKSYRRKFGEFIPVARQGKPLRFSPEAGSVCLRIRALFAQGLPIKAIHKSLLSEFPTYPENRHLSIPEKNPAQSQAASQEIEELSRLVRDMLKGMGAMATAQARTEKRLGTLERSLEKIMEMTASRLGEAQEKNPRAEAPQRRVVTVQARDGRKDSYVLNERLEHSAQEEGIGSETGSGAGPGSGPETAPETAPETGPKPNPENRPESGPESGRENGGPHGNNTRTTFSPPGRPPAEFMDMPVAIRSRGEDFLGISGKDGKPFSLTAFERHLLTRGTGADRTSSSWRNMGGPWVCTLSGQGGGGVHTMTFVRTRTPRGNTVAHLQSLEVDGKQASEAFLQAFFREIKSALGGQ